MRVNINRYFAGYFAVCLATLLRPDLQGEAPTPIRLDCQVITSGYESISIYGLWFCFVHILSLCILFSEIAASATLRKCNWKPRSANKVRIPIVFFSWFQNVFHKHPSCMLWNRFLQSGAFFSGVMRTAPPCDGAWDEIGHTILTYSGRKMSIYRLLISNKTEELLPTTTISVADVLTTGFGSNSTAKLLIGVSSVCMRRVSLFLNAIEKFNHGDSCIWGDHSAADLVFYHTGRFSVAFGVLRRRRPVHRSHWAIVLPTSKLILNVVRAPIALSESQPNTRSVRGRSSVQTAYYDILHNLTLSEELWKFNSVDVSETTIKRYGQEMCVIFTNHNTNVE